MSVSTFNVLEKKLTGGPKILFNLENKYHKFYISMIMINGGAINVFPSVCVSVWGGGEGGLDIIIWYSVKLDTLDWNSRRNCM